MSASTIGDYRVEATLAEGDVVRVVRAVGADGTRVALKLVQPGIHDEEVLRRFEREARIAQRVEHPNLVPVLGAGWADGVPYMVMRYVPGRTLTQVIEADGTLAVADVARLVGEIGAALDALHGAAIVHRDVRSSNVLIGEHGAAALSDFGFARGQADTRITELSRPVGTLDYRAPEVFLGRPADRASDIYSLGCLAYEALCGVPPFSDKADLLELGQAHLQEDPPDPSRRRPDVPADFGRGLLTALAKDPSRRPPSGASYAKLLRFALPS
ncbi:MAG: serine/threonine protein kinase [Actinomycetota bacterium]|nr:serine/threonine protein kinase [Actinomycetota bacterium]